VFLAGVKVSSQKEKRGYERAMKLVQVSGFEELLQAFPVWGILTEFLLQPNAEGFALPVTLDMMKKGTRARVVDVMGGHRAAEKLSAQGIVPGMVIEKTGELRGGPVLLRVGGAQVALGRGLAKRVLVEVIEV
jgi:ferrous iron transport protein A